MSKRSIWTIVFLVGSYVICQAIADVGATKMVAIAGLVFPAGTFIYAATFTIRDLLHKRLGHDWARAAIVVAGILNIVQAAYLGMAARLPFPPFFQIGDAWAAVFALVPAITIGSITAEVVSELTDTEIYQLWWSKRPNAPQWTRVLVSNVVSLPLDSFIFGFLAFYALPPVFGGQAMPFMGAMQAVGGQIIWKAAVTVVSLPLIYTVREERMPDLDAAIWPAS